MAKTTVLVTFYSRSGATEALAHAAAVGAVQARALIRLRRVADPDPEAIVDRFAESREPLRRMQKEYVEPREADVLAVDALIVGSPADIDAKAPEWSSFVGLLTRLHGEGKLAGKVAAAIPTGTGFESFAALLHRLDVPMVPLDDGAADIDDVSRAVALGRQVVALAESNRKTVT
jgi:flavodoxin